MKVIAFNGSPRKKWNTAMLLEKALEGATSQGAATELIHLYDHNFKGCMSCFGCKIKSGKSYGKCVVKDDLTPILEKIESADAIIFGSPVYFGTASGEMRSFMERLMFKYLIYTDPLKSLFTKKINTGFINTMNFREEQVKEYGLNHYFGFNEMTLKIIFGASESLFNFDTYQFKDYSKVVSGRFDPEKKAKRRREVFPDDCKKAFEMGSRFSSSQAVEHGNEKIK
ncbi:MAG: flavodoxin family protein [Candidatus Scalindua sp.]|jgi:multimeric flavodoxin WrbA|nr:flavodoxin family protein [Candidatus Scalindua sp.]